MTEETTPSEEIPSKTQRKKEMNHLQELGTRLTSFNSMQLDQLPLSDKLRNAISEFNRLPNSHEARRRQLQFIGRLMRKHEINNISAAIERVQHSSSSKKIRTELIESACSQVLESGDSGINTLLDSHQHLERSVLRKFFLDFSKAKSPSTEAQAQKLKNRLQKYLDKNL